ncbi:uncharacterized protein WCC33_017302 [Rhinophrynus dorsalis]
MSSGWDSGGISLLMSSSNVTVTEVMDLGFVAAVHSHSPACPTSIEQFDHRSHSKSEGSPFPVKMSDSNPQANTGGTQWLNIEEMLLPCMSRSPLPPDGQLFELSSLASEPQSNFNNSIVEVFYGAKVSTPYKEEESLETSGPVDVPVSKLQDSELVVTAVGVQKSVPPMWEISEINSALEENTPTLDVSISDLRFTSSSDREQAPPPPPQTLAAPCAQWVGVKHKDVGRSFLQPFRYQRQLSASEIPIPSNAPLLRSYHLSAVSGDELGGEWKLEVTT